MKPLLLISMCLFALSAAAGKLSIQTYPVRFTDPGDAAEIITLMLQPVGDLQVHAIDRKLVVKGTAEQHQEVQQMLRELDAPPKNIQINVQFNRNGGSSGAEAGFQQRGPIIIRNGEVHATMGGRFSNRSSTVTENTTQMLVAMDGRSATLRVGERVPYIEWLVEYGHRFGYIAEAHIEWQDVGSFLAVEPTIIGTDLIRVRVIPEISGRLKDGKRETIQFTHLATEIVAGNGQTIHIGGFNQDRDFNSHFFIGGSAGNDSMNTDITLTPRILN